MDGKGGGDFRASFDGFTLFFSSFSGVSLWGFFSLCVKSMVSFSGLPPGSPCVALWDFPFGFPSGLFFSRVSGFQWLLTRAFSLKISVIYLSKQLVYLMVPDHPTKGYQL